MTLPQPKSPAAFRKQVLSFLGETYGDKTLVLCPTIFVKLLGGDHKAAILLSQILYWGDRTKDPDGWFYKSMASWHAEIGLSEYQVRRILNGDPRVRSPQVTLRDLGVETLLRKVRHTGAPTLHWRINQAQFLAALQALLGQGDSQHAELSIPDKVQDEGSTESGMNAEKCPASLILAETTIPEISAADHDPSNPTHHPDEDSDFAVFSRFEDRFGKLKDQHVEMLRSELARLGATKVREVVDRCTARGRSWAYVLKALGNETAPEVFAQTVINERSGALLTFTDVEVPSTPAALREAPIAVSERVLTPWQSFDAAGGTVQEAWSAAIHQLEAQLDRSSFETALRGAVLVDFEPETRTFVVAVRTSYAREMLEHRLSRMVKRITIDIYGQPVEVHFILPGDGHVTKEERGRDEGIA